ncbi:MAG: hypothetical protein K6G87_12245 [Butyrivibrio sp.]|uniref:hypothetical protein n=1 Tax=Butyrivibrio sp. TaxID=28121 RepID=UPI0025D8CCCC|nr:hypothetical protein [Butyrivibrio sp.]MCR5771981.1 hypothetical protein [Butyrivibrio sp.]
MSNMKKEIEELKNTVKNMNGYWRSESSKVHQEIFADIIDDAQDYAEHFPETANATTKTEVFDSDLLD